MNFQNRKRKILGLAVAMVVSGTITSGCVSPMSKKHDGPTKNRDLKSLWKSLPLVKKDKDEHPEPYPNPVKMASTWSADTLVQTGHTPTRGFGGRIYFYDEKSRPVPVEGTLVVHGFDDTKQTDDRAPKRFEFTPDQFTRHFSQSDLGASYSIWIPWDAVGGDQKRISLVASFKTPEGKFVQGTPTTVLLPGKQPVVTEEQKLARYSPQYREYKDALKDMHGQSQIMTTTIARKGKAETKDSLDEFDLPEPVSGMKTRVVDMRSKPPTSSGLPMLGDKTRWKTSPASARLNSSEKR